MASVWDFDRHRRDGHCLHPASLGLIEVDGLWATVERHDKNRASAARLADVRSGGLVTAPDVLEDPAGGSVHPLAVETESEPLEVDRAA